MAIAVIISALVLGASANSGSNDTACTEMTCSATCNGNTNCSCSPGYELVASDNKTCRDINECSTNNVSCSYQCDNFPGSYKCACRTGYTLTANLHNCTDIDECATNTYNCSHNCNNTMGGYNCSCPGGLYLDDGGRRCLDICHANRHNCSQNCSASDVSSWGFNCSCRDGYALGNDSVSCTDIDECKSNNGGCDHTCINTDGKYKCSCRKGFDLSADVYANIDECATNTSHCSHSCNNTMGGYSCSCPGGLYLADDRRRCLDICHANRHNCSQNCVVSDVSSWGFNCSCRDGYALGNDSISCTDIDECLSELGGCSDYCYNSNGSYTCACPKGYKLTADHHNCSDMNECEENSHRCSQICVNTVGDYTCACWPNSTRASQFTCKAKPTDKEGKEQAVELVVSNMKVAEFTVERKKEFREAIAKSVEQYCNQASCGSMTSRKRRSLDNDSILANDIDVVIVEGYPKQHANGKDLLIVFYVVMPTPNPLLPQATLLSITNGTTATIAKVFGKTEADIQLKQYIPVGKTAPPNAAPSDLWTKIIIGVVVGMVAFVVLLLVTAALCRRKRNSTLDLEYKADNARGMKLEPMGEVHQNLAAVGN